LLLIELDGDQADIDRDTDLASEIIRKQQPLRFEETADAARREYLWTLRRSLSRAVTATAPLRVSEDVCVPPSKLPELVASLPALGKEFGLRVNSYGHAGDGNLHVNFLAAADNEKGRGRIVQAARRLFETTLTLGGTISGEHGIGFCKREFLELEVSAETMTIFRKIKAAFDPDNLINPGKIFD
jgi:FAD/FMN-containing dehydrogenase